MLHAYHQSVELRQWVLDIEHFLIQRENLALDVKGKLRLRDDVRRGCKAGLSTHNRV